MNAIFTVYYIFMLVLGLVIGSFLNVCIYRIPKGVSVAKGRSVCPKCGSVIKGYDNIPIISFLVLRGKCRGCKNPISPRYPIVEALGGIAFLLAAVMFSLSFETLFYCVMAACLICVAFIDIDTQEIPDRFSVIILALGVAAIFLVPEITLVQRLIGLVCVSAPMLLIMIITGGFGMGDIKLMAAAGLLLGWKNILFAGLLGAVIAAIVSLCLIAAKKKTMKDKIAFGPYLSLGIFIGAVFGSEIISAYLGLFSR